MQLIIEDKEAGRNEADSFPSGFLVQKNYRRRNYL
jgi:hypothetical protein